MLSPGSPGGVPNLTITINDFNLARGLCGIGAFPEALERFDAVEHTYTGTFGDDSIRTARARAGRALVLHARSDLAEAEVIDAAILPVFRGSYPDGGARLGGRVGLRVAPRGCGAPQ